VNCRSCRPTGPSPHGSEQPSYRRPPAIDAGAFLAIWKRDGGCHRDTSIGTDHQALAVVRGERFSIQRHECGSIAGEGACRRRRTRTESAAHARSRAHRRCRRPFLYTAWFHPRANLSRRTPLADCDHAPLMVPRGSRSGPAAGESRKCRRRAARTDLAAAPRCPPRARPGVRTPSAHAAR